MVGVGGPVAGRHISLRLGDLGTQWPAATDGASWARAPCRVLAGVAAMQLLLGLGCFPSRRSHCTLCRSCSSASSTGCVTACAATPRGS